MEYKINSGANPTEKAHKLIVVIGGSRFSIDDFDGGLRILKFSDDFSDLKIIPKQDN